MKSDKVVELAFITWRKHGSTRTITERGAGEQMIV
jgi:hypothetical protein